MTTGIYTFKVSRHGDIFVVTGHSPDGGRIITHGWSEHELFRNVADVFMTDQGVEVPRDVVQ